MQCKICDSLSEFLFEKKVLHKYDVSYFKCIHCGFIQVEKPYLLEEVYKLPFTPLDVTIASRPIELSQLTENLILNYLSYSGRFLDYGGGVGLFTRIMRDRGLNFYRQDKYAQNLFTQYFDFSNLSEEEKKFELVTSFEVLEHLENPMNELEELFSLSKNVFCSTMLQPSTVAADLESWSYIGELHGQHISFYTQETMKVIANKFDCYYYNHANYLHFFTPEKIEGFTLSRLQPKRKFLLRTINKLTLKFNSICQKLLKEEEEVHPLSSLVNKDSEMIASILKQKQY